MSGNVCEWCWDYSNPEESIPVENSTGPLKSPPNQFFAKITRGGSFRMSKKWSQISKRFAAAPSGGIYATGLRLVKSITQ